MKIKCYAKINLFLDITGADGGYHMLDTVVASVSVFDEIIYQTVKGKVLFIGYDFDVLQIPFAVNAAITDIFNTP